MNNKRKCTWQAYKVSFTLIKKLKIESHYKCIKSWCAHEHR